MERKETKKAIKHAIEKLFNVKVVDVKTAITPAAEKKAYVKLSPETPAVDITTKMGLT